MLCSVSFFFFLLSILFLSFLFEFPFLVFRFSETLEIADDMAIDIPHIWLYLAELVNPVLREGGISMRELFRYGFVYLDLSKHNGV